MTMALILKAAPFPAPIHACVRPHCACRTCSTPCINEKDGCIVCGKPCWLADARPDVPFGRVVAHTRTLLTLFERMQAGSESGKNKPASRNDATPAVALQAPCAARRATETSDAVAQAAEQPCALPTEMAAAERREEDDVIMALPAGEALVALGASSSDTINALRRPATAVPTSLEQAGSTAGAAGGPGELSADRLGQAAGHGEADVVGMLIDETDAHLGDAAGTAPNEIPLLGAEADAEDEGAVSHGKRLPEPGGERPHGSIEAPPLPQSAAAWSPASNTTSIARASYHSTSTAAGHVAGVFVPVGQAQSRRTVAEEKEQENNSQNDSGGLGFGFTFHSGTTPQQPAANQLQKQPELRGEASATARPAAAGGLAVALFSEASGLRANGATSGTAPQGGTDRLAVDPETGAPFRVRRKDAGDVQPPQQQPQQLPPTTAAQVPRASIEEPAIQHRPQQPAAQQAAAAPMLGTGAAARATAAGEQLASGAGVGPARSGHARRIVLVGTGLTVQERAALASAAAAIGNGATVADVFDPLTVTHVITPVVAGGNAPHPGAGSASTSAAIPFLVSGRPLRTCKRTVKYLQGVLCGAWVLTMDWVREVVRAGYVETHSSPCSMPRTTMRGHCTCSSDPVVQATCHGFLTSTRVVFVRFSCVADAAAMWTKNRSKSRRTRTVRVELSPREGGGKLMCVAIALPLFAFVGVAPQNAFCCCRTATPAPLLAPSVHRTMRCARLPHPTAADRNAYFIWNVRLHSAPAG